MTDVVQIVEGIRETCLNRGQDGLLELCRKFDKLEGDSLIFNIPDNIKVDNDLKNAIKTAIGNITKFHKAEAKKLAEFVGENLHQLKMLVFMCQICCFPVL